MDSKEFQCRRFRGGAVVTWLARWTSDLKVGGSSLVTAVVLFPYTRNFIPHCLSSPRCINGYR